MTNTASAATAANPPFGWIIPLNAHAVFATASANPSRRSRQCKYAANAPIAKKRLNTSDRPRDDTVRNAKSIANNNAASAAIRSAISRRNARNHSRIAPVPHSTDSSRCTCNPKPNTLNAPACSTIPIGAIQ